MFCFLITGFVGFCSILYSRAGVKKEKVGSGRAGEALLGANKFAPARACSLERTRASSMRTSCTSEKKKMNLPRIELGTFCV